MIPRVLSALLLAGGLAACGGSPAAAPSSSTVPTPTAASPSSAPVRTVVLVHGLGGHPAELNRLAGHLRAHGHRVVSVALPDNGRGDIAASAAAVQDLVRRLPEGPVDLVGFSLGGVVIREWAKAYGGARARVIMTLGSPHHGVALAALLGTDCTGACAQLVPGSAFLTALDSGDITPGAARWVTVVSDNDAVVEPAKTALLDGALGIRLQAICPGRRIGHGGLVLDPLPIALVTRALDGALPAVPPASACAALVREGAA